MDYYDVLQVARDSSPDDIKSAYHAMARRCHPDKNPLAGDEFIAVREAYDVLGNGRRRALYDAGMSPWEQLVVAQAPPDPRRVDVPATMRELLLGLCRRINYSYEVRSCGEGGHTESSWAQASLQLELAAGFSPTAGLEYPGLGDVVVAETGQSTRGSLHIFVTPQPDRGFGLDGRGSLTADVSISLLQALCGFVLPLKLPDDRLVMLRNTHGLVIKTGQVFRVIGQGLKQDAGGEAKRGDLVVTFKVECPDVLPPQLRAKLAHGFNYHLDGVAEDHNLLPHA